MSKFPQRCDVDPQAAQDVLKRHLAASQVTHDDRIYRLERQVTALEKEVRQLRGLIEIEANDDTE